MVKLTMKKNCKLNKRAILLSDSVELRYISETKADCRHKSLLLLNLFAVIIEVWWRKLQPNIEGVWLWNSHVAPVAYLFQNKCFCFILWRTSLIKNLYWAARTTIKWRLVGSALFVICYHCCFSVSLHLWPGIFRSFPLPFTDSALFSRK